jgi:hypothetical protein
MNNLEIGMGIAGYIGIGIVLGMIIGLLICPTHIDYNNQDIQLKGYVDGYFDGGYDGYNCTIEALNDTKYEFLNCVGKRATDSILRYNQTLRK